MNTPGAPDHMPLSREVWGAVLYALTQGSKATRERVADVVETEAPAEWRDDLSAPGVLVRRLIQIGVPVHHPDPETAWPGWEETRPRIPPGLRT